MAQDYLQRPERQRISLAFGTSVSNARVCLPPLFHWEQVTNFFIDYDLCDACVSSPEARQRHDVSHVFFPIRTPGKKEVFNEVRSQVEQPAVIPPRMSEALHLSVHCDGCGQYPLSGVRHKCLDCYGEFEPLPSL